MYTNLCCCHRFSCGNTAYMISFKSGIFHPALQHLRRGRSDFFDQMSGSFFHCFTGNVCGTGSIRSGIVRRRICIRTGYCNFVRITFQTFCCHLCQRCIASGSHISGTDRKQITSVFIQLNSRRTYVHVRNTGSLHGHCHTDAPHFSITHVAAREFFFPADHLCRTFQTAV